MKCSLILAILLNMASPAFGNVSPAALDAAYKSSVLLTTDVYTADRLGVVKVSRYLNCSGFVGASEGNVSYIVSAGHCIKPDLSDGTVKQIPRIVTFFDGDEGVVQKAIFKSEIDMSILKVVSRHSHPAVFLDSKLRRGLSVIILGYSEGYEWSTVSGMITQGHTRDQSGAVLFECPACQPGISGGSLYDDEGNVLGMVVAIDEKGFAYMVPSEDIAAGLRGLIK